MKKTGMLICAVVGMGGSMVAHAMDQADCIHVNLAVADMQQALIGAGNLDVPGGIDSNSDIAFSGFQNRNLYVVADLD